MSTGEQCACAAERPRTSWAALGRALTAGSRSTNIEFYSALVRPYLEYCVHFGAPQYKRDVELLERVQRRAVKIIEGLEHLLFKVMLRYQGLFSLEKKKHSGRDLTKISSM